jgi:hypothetical protein
MIGYRIVPVGAFALVIIIGPMSGRSLAGPCSGDIDHIQAQVDARLDAIAGAGSAAAESNAARLHREPTPNSIEMAEADLGEGQGPQAALAALARARTADAAGDKGACERALEEARKSLVP